VRYRLVFDPPGYKWGKEPGADFIIDGDQLANRRAPTAAGTEQAPFLDPLDNFYHFPGTTWIGCKPRQFDAGWNRSTLLADYVAPKTVWEWTTGIDPDTQVFEWNPLDVPGTPAAEGGDFMLTTVPAAPGTAPLVVNIGQIDLALGPDVTLPASMVVLAATTLSIPGEKTPMVQFRQYPEPEDYTVFGFGDVAVVCFGGVVYVLQDVSAAHDLSEWKLRGSAVMDNIDPAHSLGYKRLGQAGVTAPGGGPLRDQGMLRGLMFLPVAFSGLYMVGSAGGKVVDMRASGTTGPPVSGAPIKPGQWWFAGTPGQRLALQWQAVAYHPALHDMVPDVAKPKAIMFDLGAGYAPGTGSLPVLYPSGRLSADPYDPDGDISSVPPITAGQDYHSILYHGRLTVQLQDETGAPWVSNGARHRGGLRIELIPGDDPTVVGAAGLFGKYGCFPTQIKSVMLQFPTILAPRLRPAGMPFVIYDNEFMAFNIQTSLRDPCGKRARVLLYEDGYQSMEAAGITSRSDFPVHLESSASGTFSDAIVRAACWVQSIEFSEVIFRASEASPGAGDPDYPLRLYEFEAAGLICRMKDSPWRYFAAMVNPTGSGRLLHTEAARRVLIQSGLDTTDPTFVFVADDSAAPDDIKYLPGTPDQDPGIDGQRVDNPYGPGPGEDKASYIQRLAQEWRGWLFYESMGRQVRYEQDAREASEFGIPIDPELIAGTFFGSHAAAVFYGVPRQQVYLTGTKERFIRIKSNCVTVGGKGLDGKELDILIDMDLASINDPTALNFVGEPVRPVRLSPRMAVNARSQSIIARRYLRRLTRVDRTRDWECYLAPWEAVGPGGPATIDVGSVVELEARGYWLVCNVDVTIASNTVHTRYCGEFLQWPALARIGSKKNGERTRAAATGAEALDAAGDGRARRGARHALAHPQPGE
jgi:hypothetical protein